MPRVPVLDIGGTHVTAAVVDTDAWVTVGTVGRVDLDAHAAADAIVATLATAAGRVDVPDHATWGVAMPDPFDYVRGIGLFEGVGKFDTLRGVDVRGALLAALPSRPRDVRFLNDADAFTLGEYAHGAAQSKHRVVGLTLGTGVGSGWVVDGRIVSSGPGVPPDGRAHRLAVDGVPLENRVSRRAILAAYGYRPGVDVRDIADRARSDEPLACAVLRDALRALGTALRPAVTAFAADVVVVGGSMAGSWDLLDPWFRLGFGDAAPVRAAQDPHHAALFGAARFALNPSR